MKRSVNGCIWAFATTEWQKKSIKKNTFRINSVTLLYWCLVSVFNQNTLFNGLCDLQSPLIVPSITSFIFFCISLQDCLKPFTNGCFMELDGRPLCSLDFHLRQGTLCGGCSEPITGRCISALERKFHPEHFVCAFCLRQLSQGIFKEQKGKPYCSVCFNKLFLWNSLQPVTHGWCIEYPITVGD